MNIGKRFLIRLDEFKKFIDMLGIPNEEKEKYISVLYSEESVSKMKGNDNKIDIYSVNSFYEFIEYLYIKREEYGDDYIKDALDYALGYKEEDCSFLDQFIRFIVITNFDEIKIEFKEEGGLISMSANLGGLELSHNQNMEYSSTENKMIFSWFHNREGLKRTKLGSLMMVELFDYVLNNYPNASLCADNVKRVNVKAQAFYEKIGFNIKDIYKESNNVCVEINPSEMQESIDNNKEKYPVLLFKGKEYDYRTYKSLDTSVNSKNI